MSGLCPPQYESKKRVSAEEAMKHSYFRQLGMRVHTLPESEYSDTCRCVAALFPVACDRPLTPVFSAIAAVSIFTLKEVQLQRDPGYRSSSYPESSEFFTVLVLSVREMG